MLGKTVVAFVNGSPVAGTVVWEGGVTVAVDSPAHSDWLMIPIHDVSIISGA